MRYALRGNEKWLIWKHAASGSWCCALSANGRPLTTATHFVTWQQAMDWATS
jgi:hypothetical protein